MIFAGWLWIIVPISICIGVLMHCLMVIVEQWDQFK